MNKTKSLILYLVSILFLFIFLYFTIKVFENREKSIQNKLYSKLSNYEEKILKDKDSNVNIVYPYFDYGFIDEKIVSFISKYDDMKNIDINYTLIMSSELISIFFVVKEEKGYSYKNINYDFKTYDFVDNSYVFDLFILKDFVIDTVRKKYSTSIYESVFKDNLKSTYVSINDNGAFVYFDRKLFKNIVHKVYVELPKDTNFVSGKVSQKVIAFTFDDGPSQYTLDIVNALILNDSKATFFELGNRMKYNQDITREIYNLGMEIGDHTYAHKDLTKLDESEILEEINSTNIIFNEITGDNIKYVRPPYGRYNDFVKNVVNKPIITWDIDTNDWLYKNSDYVANHILENVKDGDIILMHDLYPETVEAVKKVLPILKERGFKVTSISELAKIKGKTLENGVVYRNIK